MRRQGGELLTDVVQEDSGDGPDGAVRVFLLHREEEAYPSFFPVLDFCYGQPAGAGLDGADDMRLPD